MQPVYRVANRRESDALVGADVSDATGFRQDDAVEPLNVRYVTGTNAAVQPVAPVLVSEEPLADGYGRQGSVNRLYPEMMPQALKHHLHARSGDDPGEDADV